MEKSQRAGWGECLGLQYVVGSKGNFAKFSTLWLEH